MMRGPLTGDELTAVLDPDGDILDEIVSVDQGEIVGAMAREIQLHRDAMAPAMRATRLYTDELGALRKRVAELEAGLRIELERWNVDSHDRLEELLAGNSLGTGPAANPDDPAK